MNYYENIVNMLEFVNNVWKLINVEHIVIAIFLFRINPGGLYWTDHMIFLPVITAVFP